MGTSLNFEDVMEVVEIHPVLDLDIVRPRFDDYKQEAARIAEEAKALMIQDQESLNIAHTSTCARLPIQMAP